MLTYADVCDQVALSLSDQARFIMYLTDPREEEWQVLNLLALLGQKYQF